MNMNKINPYINLLNNFSSKNQKNITKISCEIKDSVSFSGKNKQSEDEPILIGANYDSIAKNGTKRNGTILDLKRAIKKGEDISKERDALILSRIPKAIELAEEIVLKYPDLDINDVIQDLIRIVIEQTDKDLNSDAEQNCFPPLYQSALRTYIKHIDLEQARKSKKVTAPRAQVAFQESPYSIIEDEELKLRAKKAKDKLIPAQQFVLDKRFGFSSEPKDYSEIAKELCVSPQCISERVRRGVENIRKILTEEG